MVHDRHDTATPTTTLLDGLSKPALLIVAAPTEANALLEGFGCSEEQRTHTAHTFWQPLRIRDNLSMVLSGVGKANAAAALAWAIASQPSDRPKPVVLSIGLAGALPAHPAMSVGQVVCADCCHLADEGVQTDNAFHSLADLGFPASKNRGETFSCSTDMVALLAPLADRLGSCATVSTCSGTDDRAAAIASRTGAVAEDMESAAVGLAAAQLGLDFGCLRVISNTTGHRNTQRWDLDAALARLTRLARML